MRRRKQESRSFRLFSMILIVLFLGILAFGAIRLMLSIKKNDTEKARRSVSETVVYKEKKHVEPKKENEPESPERQTYHQAIQLMRIGNFKDARDMIAPVCESRPENFELYEQCRLLLNTCSTEIYRNEGIQGISTEYVVKRGDTLSHIAKTHHTTVDNIRKCNGMNPNSASIRQNQKLKITKSAWKTIVQIGNCRILLYDGDKLFKCYPISVGTMISSDITGTYTVSRKEKNPVWHDGKKRYPAGSQENIYGTRLLKLESAESPGLSVFIHGNAKTKADVVPGAVSDGYFQMLNADAEELYDLLPQRSEIQITD